MLLQLVCLLGVKFAVSTLAHCCYCTQHVGLLSSIGQWPALVCVGLVVGPVSFH